MKKIKSGDYKLWILVTAVFIVLISMWAGLIWVAKKNEPQSVEIQSP